MNAYICEKDNCEYQIRADESNAICPIHNCKMIPLIIKSYCKKQWILSDSDKTLFESYERRDRFWPKNGHAIDTYWIYGNETNEPPHVHIKRLDDNDCCLYLLPKDINMPYYIHGRHTRILNCKELKTAKTIISNNWDEAVSLWNIKNNNIIYDKTIPLFYKM